MSCGPKDFPTPLHRHDHRVLWQRRGKTFHFCTVGFHAAGDAGELVRRFLYEDFRYLRFRDQNDSVFGKEYTSTALPCLKM